MSLEPQRNTKNYESLQLTSLRGESEARLYSAKSSTKAIIWFGGVGGGWDTPAQGLYPEMSQRLTETNITSLRLRFRFPGQIEECVSDALAAVDFLTGQGHQKITIGGHSFGGAVAVLTAQLRNNIRGLIMLAAQSYRAETIGQIKQDCTSLFIHGMKDRILAFEASRHLHRLAKEPKEIHLLPEDGHNLDESHEKVHELVYSWILRTPT